MSIPNFQKHPLIPAIIQDPDTRTVLMQGYMNLEAFEKTLETKKVWFYSRSKERLWMKGETSSNVLEFSHYRIDCDADSIWFMPARQAPFVIRVVRPVSMNVFQIP